MHIFYVIGQIIDSIFKADKAARGAFHPPKNRRPYDYYKSDFQKFLDEDDKDDKK